MKTKDFRDYYNLESYLFEKVSCRFKRDSKLSAFDFFCIIIWKANRSKSKVAKRLITKGYSDLKTAVSSLTTAISHAPCDKERLRILIKNWGFRIPTASAILSVLYPCKFSVYDVRVCDAIGSFHKLQNKTNFDNLWEEYQLFIEQIKKSSPDYNLRDKDRWLWGKSFHEQLKNDISNQF